MESPQIVYLRSLIEELHLNVLENQKSVDQDEERKKIDIRALNKKINNLYKKKIIDLVEIDRLRKEKRDVLDEFHFSYYIGEKCNRRIRYRSTILNNQLEDLINK